MGKAAAKSKELKAAMLRGQEQAEGSFWLWKPGERAWEKGKKRNSVVMSLLT